MKSAQKWLYFGIVGLIVYMPFHVFLAQSLSLATGGIAIWKVAKDVVTFTLLILAVILAYSNRRQVARWYWWVLALAGLYGLLHVLVLATHHQADTGVALLATAYNARAFAYFVIGLTAGALLPQNKQPAVKLALYVSGIVAVLGILQYFLPKDILTHAGYSSARGIRAAFFIDDKPDLPRINSTLRDPNSLGAFLLIPITLLWLRVLTETRRRWQMVGLLGVMVIALLLTFSRAAWLATCLSLGIVTVAYHRHVWWRYVRRYWPVIIIAGVVLLAGVYMLRDQYQLQNIIFHSDENTTSKLDSNGYHVAFARQGLHGIAANPLGHGPGTAGIVSIQNKKGGLLTENYFIQIGYEVGLFGLALFIAMLGWVQWRLFQQQDWLSQGLAAAFCGFLLMAMVSHLWSNEAVALYAWLFAGWSLMPAQQLSKPAKPRRVRR
jgi:O-antigen ligase